MIAAPNLGSLKSPVRFAIRPGRGHGAPDRSVHSLRALSSGFVWNLG